MSMQRFYLVRAIESSHGVARGSWSTLAQEPSPTSVPLFEDWCRVYDLEVVQLGLEEFFSVYLFKRCFSL